VVKKQNTNEYDQLITCYTEEFGRLTAIAKSILKKSSLQAMHLDVLNLVEFELVNGRAMPIIASAHSENIFKNIKGSMKKFAVANFFMDVIDKLIFDNEKDPKIWNLLTAVMAELNTAEENKAIKILRNGQKEFLRISGYSPRTDNCAICLTKVDNQEELDHEWALNFDLGGLICRNCYLQTNRGVLLKNNDLKILLGQDHRADKGHKSSLDVIFENLMGRRLNSLDFVYRIMGA
jgi:DNA repair protein RecO (recombination protein O)